MHAAPVLKALDLPATFFIVSRFVSTDHAAWWDSKLDPKPTWITWEEVQGLVDMGFNIGAHTQNHVDLGTVASEVAQAEIIGSKADLESRLGKPIDLFAYPYGQVENLLEDNRSKVQAAGFRCCASCFGGLVQPGDDPFRLNRVAISNWFESPEQLALAIGTHRV